MLNRFLELYDLVMEQIQGGPFEFENMTIALIPGSFKPPHKGHWEMVIDFIDKADKVIVLISNISTATISSRPMSLSNLKTFEKINEYFQKAYDKTENAIEVLKDQKAILDDMTIHSDNLPYDELRAGLKIISEMPGVESKEYMKFKNAIDSYIERLDKSLFTSIRKTANGTEITPEMSKEIFEIFAKAYGVQDKVDIRISKSASPISSTYELANHSCKDCRILLGVSKKGGDESRWDALHQSEDNPTNELISSPVEVQTMLSATELRNGINDLQRSWFPDKLTDEDFEKIKHILNAN